MGVGLVRSLQPPDILWIHWRVYNFIANTSKWVLFLPSSDVYVRSFRYLLYTLIKLYYTNALSDQAMSLAPDWILFLGGPKIPVSLCDSTTFHQVRKNRPQHWMGEGYTHTGSMKQKSIFSVTICTLFCETALRFQLSEEDNIMGCRMGFHIFFSC